MTEQNIQTGETDEPLVCYPSNTVTAARAEIYAQFSVAFSYPEADVLLRLSNGELEQEIHDAIASLAPSLNVDIENQSPARNDNPAELKTLYSSLFDVTGGTPAVSLFQRRYVEDPEQQLWEKLLRFYGHFGLDFSQGSSQEKPDHLLT